MIGGQGEDSCRKSGIDETPQERSDEETQRPPAESEVLHRNQQRYNKQSTLVHLSCLFVFGFMTQPFLINLCNDIIFIVRVIH
ncbi:hypothetical protein [Priestia megaterium]|uniref:hypothetical protein n=1 Tax=Priestia megaterium TaxID=1404 RepID=UPI0004B7A9A7|nr:hypothetical protein [Priestia megaterium]MCM3544406.1 hypothetical protein [Priestia megaterium]MEC1066674.1 hypothetical protein [Priestia megaterium]